MKAKLPQPPRDNGAGSSPKGQKDTPAAYSQVSAAELGLASCHVCALVSPASDHARCPRCGAALHLRKADSLQRTLALTVAAAILYIPANLFPIMNIEGLGSTERNTIIGGVITFWKMESYLVAIIIFTASVIIPILKFIALFWLCYAARPHSKSRNTRLQERHPHQATLVYRITEIVGRWSMVDVFVVAVMVALVRFGNLMSISPGSAALSFAAVVILTMLAAHAFDPRLLWDRTGRHTGSHAITLPLTLPRPERSMDKPHPATKNQPDA